MLQIYMPAKRVLYSLLMLTVTTLYLIPAEAQVKITLTPVIDNTTVPPAGTLTNPIDIVNAGDLTNRIFVAQQNGIIKVYDQSYTYLSDFLTVTGISSGGERGLLSIAFHPDYKNNGYFFVYYTNIAGAIELARYHTPPGTPNTADPASKELILTIPHLGQTNHNGGKLNFGNDGYLYFATGDGGGSGDVPNNAQTGTVLLGKMLRINVSAAATGPLYTIPPDNPFLVPGDNIMDEIWAFGLRNPFRWSFDRLTHDMWIGDVGQGQREEVDFTAAGTPGGLNYGWHCKEGFIDYNGGCAITTGVYAPPLLDYTHNTTTGGFAIIGGFVYRGTLNPAMTGYYVFADNSTNHVWLLPPGGAAADTLQFKNILSSISAFGEAENGELYATSLTGALYYLQATNAALPVKLLEFRGASNTGYNELFWKATDEVQFRQYEIEYSSDGIGFQQAGIVAAANSGSYYFKHNIGTGKKIYYRLKMTDIDGKAEYSKTIILAGNYTTSKNFVTPSIVTNKTITVSLAEAYTSLQIINMDGKLVQQELIGNRTGNITVRLSSVPAGQYLVRLTANGKQVMQKIVVQ